ncbi:MAG: Integral rane sensor signal transduction histidine kinase, partial [Hyphomicrobiales bacterium]|nr:Integral rane sensor signal transduction histidine kinase [Hyphomicrobiales bacterium]
RVLMGRALVTSLVWLVIIGTLGGLFVARRVLRRVDAMNATTRSIMNGDLAQRLPLAGSNDELDRLALNLNAMLDRIAELMAGLKEVSDNIAHDLKTPLTRLRNKAEQALRSAQTPAEFRTALDQMIEESDGLIRIFNALLMIARLESGGAENEMAPFDVAEMTQDVGELYEPLADEEGTQLIIEAEPGLQILGNRELIGQATANLVDNAIKYGRKDSDDASGGDIKLVARKAGESVEIEVSDRGPGIAAADRARVLDRFVRLEGSRSRPGSGLGLSLAAAVTRLHGGQLRIEDNSPGLRVVIALPLRAPPPALPQRARPVVVQPTPSVAS